jgi:DNA-directed RNA polymerase subunit K
VAKKSSPSAAAPPEEKFMRFERARIVGARALQIAMGAPVILDIERGFLDPVSIAEREYKLGLVPITVIRPAGGAPKRKRPGITVTPKFLRRHAGL